MRRGSQALLPGTVSLLGSNFEIDIDANLKVDNPGALDWNSPTVVANGSFATDKASGPGDDSFGQGTKEDTTVPTIVAGSIPPNKSDLLHFGVYLETAIVQTDGGPVTRRFLNMFWHRVQEPQGTTNMDFEFNQSRVISANGVTPVRTAGDLLIQYDLAQGGTVPILSLSRWVTSGSPSQCEASNSVPCWGTKTNLTSANDATGSINSSAIPSTESGVLNGDISPRTFGEAQIDFDAVASTSGGGCVGFGSAYLKSRSSDSFTAALKDFIAPIPVNVSNCGTVKIIKVDDTPDGGAPLTGAVFTLFKDNPPTFPTQTSHGPEDTVTSFSCTTGMDGTCTITNVTQGLYWAVETTTPPGHDSAPDQSANVTPDSTITLTFVNPRQRGGFKVNKTRKHHAAGSGPQPHPGVTFTITDLDGGVIDGGVQTTNAGGIACFDGLFFGSYKVTETLPAGYSNPNLTQTQVVSTKASCSDSQFDGGTANFVNTPLSDITVSFHSEVDGGTAATISCSGLTPSSSDANSSTFTGLTPNTYTCTVVIDP
jgi:hypothetical protein